MESAILFGLILINGFFAMSEISLVTARKARLQRLIDLGDRGAQVATQLGAEPTKFLSTIQIGITSVSMLSGIVGEATLAPPLEAWLMAKGMGLQAAGYLATGLVVALVTYFAEANRTDERGRHRSHRSATHPIPVTHFQAFRAAIERFDWLSAARPGHRRYEAQRGHRGRNPCRPC
jgi:hypothetical protein